MILGSDPQIQQVDIPLSRVGGRVGNQVREGGIDGGSLDITDCRGEFKGSSGC